ncbi:MAG: hypothetical protein SCI25_15240 [Desulfuromonadales bacterium]|nr:hypothetical protein [Desulfuromonadales bacterium]MDW7758810.1 hypothetical protein [Desulfuromonadales bacterium]
MHRLLAIVLLSALLAVTGGCSRGVVGGAALGAGAAGAAYEYSNKKALGDLEDDYKAGRISEDEYFRRKKEIEGKSLIY